MSPTFEHGLVIGKFYPPHAGHRLLVRSAARLCRHVTVVVMASSAESLPLALRVGWMEEIHRGDPTVTVRGVVDDVRVDYADDAVWRAHVALMREALGGVAIDCVLTSEAYGDELGRRLGVRHVLVDAARSLVPISATAVRARPDEAWEHLAPCVRERLALRVVIVGAESTGKSTLAERLARSLRERSGPHGLTRVVAELGREYTVEKLGEARARAFVRGEPPPAVDAVSWSAADFADIATGQRERERLEARVGGPVVVCDTDAFATSIWHERYAGSRSVDVDAIANLDLVDARRLHLLTHHDDVPFVQDGLRDGELIRAWMTATFASRLTETGRRWAWLRGTREERLATALDATFAFLAEGSRLAAPLG